MKDNDNHKLSDDELEAWLAGTDDVSAMHRGLEQESPPAALDAQILARARQSVDGKSGARNDVFIRPYATAATVFLCLAITFMLVNEPDLPTPADLRSTAESLEIPVPVTLPQEAPRAAVAEADATASPDVNTGTGATTRAVPVQTGNLTELLDLVEQRRLSEPAGTATQDQTPEPDTSTASTAARAPLVNVNETRQQAAEADDTAGALDAVRLENTLEEIVLTGSRIEDAFGYRNDRQAWLEEIARLRAQGETATAADEADRFLERYPDADLEAELAAIETP